MKQKRIIGLFLCGILVTLGFVIQGDLGLYLNLAALCIVIGGTLFATLISYKLERLVILFKTLKNAQGKTLREPDEIVEILIDLSLKSRIKGLFSLEEDEAETSILFLRRALGFLVDGYKADEIKDILSTEMYFFKLRRDESERALRSIADLCPSFGLVGSVIGLIGMLSGIDNTSIVIATIPIALSSTLYGIIIANMILIPFAANITERTQQELLLQKMILEGVLAIKSNSNPRILENRLKSFLTPSSRNTQLISLQTIRDRLKDYNSVDLQRRPRPKAA
jgi:chemotaxis protein MotA